MGELRFRPASVADLEAIYDFIAADNPSRALAFVDSIRRRCRALTAHPRLGPAREDLGQGIRILPLPQRVIVAYRLRPPDIVVVRVFHGGRDYEALLRSGPTGEDQG